MCSRRFAYYIQLFLLIFVCFHRKKIYGLLLGKVMSMFILRMNSYRELYFIIKCIENKNTMTIKENLLKNVLLWEDVEKRPSYSDEIVLQKRKKNNQLLTWQNSCGETYSHRLSQVSRARQPKGQRLSIS